MNSIAYYVIIILFLLFVGFLIYTQSIAVRKKKSAENRCLLVYAVACFQLLFFTSCKNPAPEQQTIKESDTTQLADLYFDGMKFEYLPKELKGNVRTNNLLSNDFTSETQLLVQSEYYKSYMDPKDNRYEASLVIYEISSEQELVDNIDTCIAYIKKINWQTALRKGRFLIIFNSASGGDWTKFSNDTNRKIFENFYLSKGAQVVYQGPTDEENFYFDKQD